MEHSANTPLWTRDLSIGYTAGQPVLGNINVALRKSGLTVLVGSNGSGKSTLLRTLSGAQAALSGSVGLYDRPVGDYSRRELSRMLAMVYTDRTMAGGLTVEETVAIGRQPYTGLLGRLSSADREIVARSIDDVGMTAKSTSFLANLSDGERQKVMIARALAQDAPVVVLDEPTAFLDVASRLEIMGLLKSLTIGAQGKTVLLSSHDIAPSLAVADDIWVVNPVERRLVAGTRDEILDSGVLDCAFPGRDIRFDPDRLDYVLGRRK